MAMLNNQRVLTNVNRWGCMKFIIVEVMFIDGDIWSSLYLRWLVLFSYYQLVIFMHLTTGYIIRKLVPSISIRCWADLAEHVIQAVGDLRRVRHWKLATFSWGSIGPCYGNHGRGPVAHWVPWFTDEKWVICHSQTTRECDFSRSAPVLWPPQTAVDIDRNQLIEEDKRYRREVAKKNAAKAQLVTA